MVCGVLVARVPGQRPTPTSHECTFLFFFFVNSSTPMPSSRSHRQIRWRCAHEKELYWCTTAWRCPAPASLRQLLCCAEENPFRSRHHIHVPRPEGRHIRLEFSQRFLDVDPSILSLAPGIVTVFEPRHPSLRAAASICVFRGFGHLSELCVAPFPATSVELLQLVSTIDAIANSNSEACAARTSVVPSSLPSARMSPETFPSVLCGLLAPTSLCRNADSRLFASSLEVRCRLKKVRAGSLMQSIQSAQCASGVGSSRSASNFTFDFSNQLSTAFRNSTRLSPFCRQRAIA